MTGNAPRPFAVVTGASSGIGLELAKLFAADGYDLLITANEDLGSAAEQIGAGNGSVIEPVEVDLAQPGGVDTLYAAITGAGRPVDALALNAGRGAGGAFVPGSHPSGHATALADELETVDLNVRATVHLAKLVLTDMVARDEGQVLFTSSVASELPGAYQAVYNASKSFVQSLVTALQEELKDSGVTLTSLMPGPTDTRFFARAKMLDTLVGTSKKDDPADVARMGYDAMRAGEPRAVAASLITKVQAEAAKVIPDRIKAVMHREIAEPGSAKD